MEQLSKILRDQLRKNDERYIRELIRWFCAPVSFQTPSQYIEENITLDTPFARNVPFTFEGREYLRDQIDDIDNPEIIYQTTCAGTGTGKTTRDLAQMLWAFKHDPFPGLYIMPSLKGPGGVTGFVNKCIITTLECSPVFQPDIPRGAKRHNFSGQRLAFIGNDMDFAGANSAVQLGNKRCRIVWLGEQDKYKEKLGREAGADYLAGERTKNMSNTKIIRGSTPTLEAFGIWPHLIGSGNSTGSDCRRRFLPCPKCNPNPADTFDLQKHFVLVKDEQYTVLPLKFPFGTAYEPGTIIPAAQLRWDKEAKRKDDSWDMDRVIRSARFECPHCGAHIRDEHRLWLDKNGKWIPTRAGEHGHRGYHLPSFYAPLVLDKFGQQDFNSTWGGMAQKFLKNVESGTDMGGYINSDLAEVHVSQEHSIINISDDDKNFATEDWTPLMTCDFQKLWPFIWFIVQKWSSFKLHPPFPIANGRPKFADHLDKNPALKSQCEKIVGGNGVPPSQTSPAWIPLAEILRFDPRTGQFPILDFIIAQKITGQNLVNLWRDQCGMNTLNLGRYLYREMGLRMPKGGDSEVIASGHCELSGDDAWTELREYQQQFAVGQPLKKFNLHPNRAVAVDSGYMESHNPEVLRKCYESGEGGRFEWYDPVKKQFVQFQVHQFCRPVPIDCWVPYKGYPIRQAGRWKSAGIGTSTHWAADDPFKGLAEAGKRTIAVLETASEHYFRRWIEKRHKQKEIRAAIEAGKTYRSNIWNISKDCVYIGHQCKRREDLEAQLNSKGVSSDGEIWEKGSGGGKHRYPDHLLDCASQMQESLAEVLGFFSYERQNVSEPATK